MLKHVTKYFPPYLTREQALYQSVQKQSTEDWINDYKEKETECMPKDSQCRGDQNQVA